MSDERADRTSDERADRGPGMDLAHLVGRRGTSSFTVAPEHTTTVFGEQDDPPGLPAADDATPEEAVSVLGTPHLLARVEFTARESIRGGLPAGMGVVGERMEVTHRGPATVGADLAVETAVARVEGRRVVFEGDVDDGDRCVGRATVVLRVIERDRFRTAVDRG